MIEKTPLNSVLNNKYNPQTHEYRFVQRDFTTNTTTMGGSAALVILQNIKVNIFKDRVRQLEIEQRKEVAKSR